MKHIAINIDDKYTDYAIVFIQSVIEYNESITFHILHNGLSENSINRIKSNINKNTVLEFYSIDSSCFKGMPVSNQWPEAIYYRILITNVIPKTVDRILYCDCDIIIRGSLSDLWNTNLDEKAIAAVEDVLSPISPMLEKLDCDPMLGYFNSGVMLINCDYWRKNNIPAKVLKYISKNITIIKHPDQDGLNAVLNELWVKLHYKWNFLSSYQELYYEKKHLDDDYYKNSIHYPIIIHFSGVKPWESGCRTRYKFEYWRLIDRCNVNILKPKSKIKHDLIYFTGKIFDLLKIRKLKVNYYR